MSPYSVVISTFLRPLKLERCLETISTIPVDHQPATVVVCDDGESHSKKDRVYDDYAAEIPLDVIDLPYDTGLSKKRNEGLARVDTEYVLLLDDDQYVPSNIYELASLLDANPGLGGVAPFWEEHGDLKCNAADYRFDNGWALKDVHGTEPESTGTGHVMFRYDHIPNAAMFRTEVFDDYTWDEFYVIQSEDTDFYLQHRQLGVWDFAVTPNYVLRHDPGPGTIDAYVRERKSIDKLNESLEYLTSKFDIKGVLQVDRHLSPKRTTAGKLAHWTATNVIPNVVLWELRRRPIGFYLEEKLLPDQA